MKLRLFKYKYLPYEKRFLENEINKKGGSIISLSDNEIIVSELSLESALGLTYVESIVKDNGEVIPTVQSERELINGRSSSAYQSTRYGPHGLHDYKGKFNPQTPRSLLIQYFSAGENILDPFMGSGTTMVEARELGLNAFGVELNPFAYEVAYSKVKFEELTKLPTIDVDLKEADSFVHPYSEYLQKWFTDKQFVELMAILAAIAKSKGGSRKILEIVLSDQIRNNSLQDPRDLRIRRLKDAPNASKLVEDFLARYEHIVNVHRRWLAYNEVKKTKVNIFNGDSTKLQTYIKPVINGSVCSPPYFSALPYVDTYRLSMVALGLISPAEIQKEERKLIGARDITKAEKNEELQYLDKLPPPIIKLVNHLLNLLEKDETAGFRKQAVPYNLIRYCRLMKNVLSSLYEVEVKGAYNLWVVGPNRASIGGEDITIDTPQIILDIAKFVGFNEGELEPVDAYSRFDIHSKNSIRHESIVKFRK